MAMDQVLDETNQPMFSGTAEEVLEFLDDRGLLDRHDIYVYVPSLDRNVSAWEYVNIWH